MTPHLRKIAIYIPVFMALITTACLSFASDGGPVEMVKSVANQMLSGVKNNKATLKKNPGVVYGLARKIIVPHADFDEMSMRVLPRETWNTATASERSAFKKAFTTTLIRTYASALASYTDQTITFQPVRGGYEGRSIVSVSSQIGSSDGPAISVVYSLRKTGSQWKLYDMTVEGVSMLQSFRSQFSDQLSRGNMTALLRVLQEHNAGRASGDT